jgi:L-threonylcarbamoyladenylate synthase
VEVVQIDGAALEGHALQRADAALAGGGLLIYPTDTLYALGGRALLDEVGAKVRRVKSRGSDKPLPLVAADIGQVAGLCAEWSSPAQALARHFWPGPLTLVLRAASSVPESVTAGTGTVAVRVPALALARALCRLQGPLISTSANRAGEPPPTTCSEAIAGVGSAVTLALDAGPGQSVASTVVDVTTPSPVLIRAGAVAWDDVRSVGWDGGSG